MLNLSNPMISYNEAKKYLFKNEHLLSEEEIETIKNFMTIERQENNIFAEKLIDCKLYKLAQSQLKREGKARGHNFACQKELAYDYDPVELLYTMHRIQITAEEKGIKI